MGRKCILVDREKFTNAINDYCQHKITMAVACKRAGMSEPTFRKYLRMCWLGQPLPEELFERKNKHRSQCPDADMEQRSVS